MGTMHRNDTRRLVYGFVSDAGFNLKFNEYSIHVLFRKRWGRDKCQWSKLGSFEKFLRTSLEDGGGVGGARSKD